MVIHLINGVKICWQKKEQTNAEWFTDEFMLAEFVLLINVEYDFKC